MIPSPPGYPDAIPSHAFPNELFAFMTSTESGRHDDEGQQRRARVLYDGGRCERHSRALGSRRRTCAAPHELAECAANLINARAKEILLQSVGRRLGILRRALHHVVVLFPPSGVKPIDRDSLDDAQISFHAFVINLYGLIDNLARAFVWRDGLENSVDRKQVGTFSHATKRCWPDALREYVESPTTVKWVTEYLKNA